MKEFAIRPTILTRDIRDCLESLRDHLENESADIPVLKVSNNFRDLPVERQLDMVIDFAGPWYVRFVASWSAAEIERLWVRYEDLVADAAGTIARVGQFHNLDLPPDKIDDAVNALGQRGNAQLRFNKGVEGRGRQLMTSEQQGRIARLLDYYPEIDRSLVGI